MAYSLAQLRRLEELEQREETLEYPSFLALLSEQASDTQESLARREWEIYHLLSPAERTEVHRLEIERLEKSAGIDADLKGKFLAIEREALAELEAKASKEAALERRETETRPVQKRDRGEKGAQVEPRLDPLRHFKERDDDGQHSIEPRIVF